LPYALPRPTSSPDRSTRPRTARRNAKLRRQFEGKDVESMTDDEIRAAFRSLDPLAR
jgi:hypothetical protein